MSANSRSSTCASTASNGMSGRSAGGQRVQERAVGLRIPEVPALGVGEREPARRGDHADGAGRLVEALRDELAEDALLVGVQPHERRDRVVEVGLAGAVALGQRLARALVEEVHAAGDDDLGEADAADDPQAVRARGVDAVHQRVGQLGQGVVDHALERALLAQVLHRGPADAVGVEDHGLVARVLEDLAQPHHARRRLAEHRDPDAVLAERAERRTGVVDHPGHRRRRVVEDRS